VDEWQRSDGTLILEVLARYGRYWRTKMAKRKRKKITLSREFYERHEWIQRNIAERLAEHKRLREQRSQRD